MVDSCAAAGRTGEVAEPLRLEMKIKGAAYITFTSVEKGQENNGKITTS